MESLLFQTVDVRTFKYRGLESSSFLFNGAVSEKIHDDIISRDEPWLAGYSLTFKSF